MPPDQPSSGFLQSLNAVGTRWGGALLLIGTVAGIALAAVAIVVGVVVGG